MYCSEYFNVFEYIVGTSYEIKNVSGILAKPVPKKGQNITTETLHLVTNVYEDDDFSSQVPEKKDHVSVREYIIKNFATCKNYILFSQKNALI